MTRTFVDSSVLIAVLYPDDEHADNATSWLGEAYGEGSILINNVVYAELAADPAFETVESLDTFLDSTGIRVVGTETEAMFDAGERFQEYLDRRGEELQCPSCGEEAVFECGSCGEPVTARQHIPADFLIGADASNQADRLISFDTGFFSTYFPEIALVSS